MPYYHFREVWTPLAVIRIRFFKDSDDKMWVKIGNRHKRKIR